jgi:hypothetical protein
MNSIHHYDPNGQMAVTFAFASAKITNNFFSDIRRDALSSVIPPSEVRSYYTLKTYEVSSRKRMTKGESRNDPNDTFQSPC